MSGLDKRVTHSLIAYALASIFCYILQAVYISKSYGASSPYMHFMFLIPLISGVFPTLIELLTHKTAPTATAWLWNAATATLCFGFLVRGIINISGRETDYFSVYVITAAILWLASLIMLVAYIYKAKQKKC